MHALLTRMRTTLQFFAQSVHHLGTQMKARRRQPQQRWLEINQTSCSRIRYQTRCARKSQANGAMPT